MPVHQLEGRKVQSPFIETTLWTYVAPIPVANLEIGQRQGQSIPPRGLNHVSAVGVACMCGVTWELE